MPLRSPCTPQPFDVPANDECPRLSVQHEPRHEHRHDVIVVVENPRLYLDPYRMRVVADDHRADGARHRVNRRRRCPGTSSDLPAAGAQHHESEHESSIRELMAGYPHFSADSASSVRRSASTRSRYVFRTPAGSGMEGCRRNARSAAYRSA